MLWLTLRPLFRWEQKLSVGDVNILVRFREEKFPDIHEHFRGLDFLGVRTIISGLLAYGWTYTELSHCRSELMMVLGRYIDREQLLLGNVLGLGQQTVDQTFTSYHSPAAVELLLLLSRKRTPPPESSNKRICTDPDDAVQLNSARPYYSAASDHYSSLQYSGDKAAGSNDISRTIAVPNAQLLHQYQLQAGSPTETMAPSQTTWTNTVQQASILTRGPAAPEMVHIDGFQLPEQGLGQVCGTSNGSTRDNGDGKRSLSRPRQLTSDGILSNNTVPEARSKNDCNGPQNSSGGCQPVVQNSSPVSEGSLNPNTHESGASAAPSISLDANVTQPMQDMFQSKAAELAPQGGDPQAVDFSPMMDQSEIGVTSLMSPRDDVSMEALMRPWDNMPGDTLDFLMQPWDDVPMEALMSRWDFTTGISIA